MLEKQRCVPRSWNHSTLLSFSDCQLYGQEKDYVNAHAIYERALSLLSVPERTSYIAKFARLREQAEDVKNDIYREDPLDFFPLEVVINILRFGLDKDPFFALKQSWINRRWRDTINLRCPELWKNMDS